MKVQHWAMMHDDCVWGLLTKLLSILNKDITDGSLVSIPSGSGSLSAAMLFQYNKRKLYALSLAPKQHHMSSTMHTCM